jgi:hypothetical protein
VFESVEVEEQESVTDIEMGVNKIGAEGEKRVVM